MYDVNQYTTRMITGARLKSEPLSHIPERRLSWNQLLASGLDKLQRYGIELEKEHKNQRSTYFIE